MLFIKQYAYANILMTVLTIYMHMYMKFSKRVFESFCNKGMHFHFQFAFICFAFILISIFVLSPFFPTRSIIAHLQPIMQRATAISGPPLPVKQSRGGPRGSERRKQTNVRQSSHEMVTLVSEERGGSPAKNAAASATNSSPINSQVRANNSPQVRANNSSPVHIANNAASRNLPAMVSQSPAANNASPARANNAPVSRNSPVANNSLVAERPRIKTQLAVSGPTVAGMKVRFV